MGNLCGEERQEQKQLMKSKLCLSKVIGKAFVQILQGDILSESASAILNLAHDPYSAQFIKIQVSSINTRPQLIAGIPTITPFHQNGIPFVIHLKIPNNFHLQDQEDQIQAFVDAFELANSQNMECISFTEPPKDIAQNQKKDIYAKLILSAFQFFIFNSTDSKITLLKIINPDQNTTNIYMKELLQIAVISAKQSYDVDHHNNTKEKYKKQNDQPPTQPTLINIEQKANIENIENIENTEQTCFKEQEQKQEEIFQSEDQQDKQQEIKIENNTQEIQQQDTQVQNDKFVVEPPQQVNNVEFDQTNFINDYSKVLVSEILQKSIENLQSSVDS
ncbi:unnamed protein product (macronuclear) [Paramecium tetraurelia]|uniref:Uncharacterized protein n=1 Tax=Paramecium tetraurelia TaxID=5888 RepID=A0EFF9_PARTE|nr:uncharacterized protein GSPATT00026373001 [Paramecium tetraurelia]CAK94050.1 unnamed protein product [Paramecium tetraurelia]|eukprot:XP_001461423.1 hypothetical protein (macronuclear) [Paramecium tetraurelia strain d4-2]